VTTDKPYRISTDAGYRKYLCSGMYLPSVTTVLSATETAKSKASLKNWQEKNPGALEAASARGSAIHLGCEQHLRGLPVDIPEEYQGFWNGMSQYLDWFDTIHWSERPLRPDWYHLRSDDKEVSYVWSTVHKYAGCPDLIGEIGGVKVIADFKTSNGPYMNTFPDRGDRMGFGGFRKFQKCAQQMAAYRLALEERTGFRCDVALVIASTEETTQAIFIDGDQLSLYESRFLKRAEQFHSLEDDNADPDCGEQELHQQDESAADS
tara:strand:- start:673 stop:1464 length:792 start_codon:yes stop_codon:yes gene_type:complete